MNSMYRYKKKIVLMALLIVIQALFFTSIVTHAQTINGVIDETPWTIWFEDSANPSYTAFFYENDTTVFIGIVTNITETGSNQIQIAFKAAQNDFAILYSDISGYKFKPNTIKPDSSFNYWAETRLGLPTGVVIIQGVTDGKISYEICISKELLGKYGEEFPDKFNLWLMYTPEGSGGWIWSIIDTEGEVNFYPESRSDWWFSFVESDVDDKIPVFHAPEIPYGSILSLFSMLVAYYAISKKNSPFSSNV